MKKLFMFALCSVLLVLTMAACTPNSSVEKSNGDDGSASGATSEDANQTSNSISWHNLSKHTEGLTEREQTIVNYFDNDYIIVHDYASLTKYANIYKNANIRMAPLAIAKILSSDKDTYEAIAIYSDSIEWFYPSPEANDFDFSLDGRSLVHIKGNQPSDGTLVAEHDLLTVYGQYQGMMQKEIDGKTYNIAELIEDKKLMWYSFEPIGGSDIRNDLSWQESAAKAIFNNDIKVETLGGSEGGDGYAVILATPNNQTNADVNSFILYSSGLFPVDKNMLTTNSGVEGYDWADYYLSEDKYGYPSSWLINGINGKSCAVSADFDHLIFTTFNQSLKKVYVDYYEISTFNKVWGQEFDGVDIMAYDYTVENMYLVIDDKLHIISTEDGADIAEPIFVVGQVSYISGQPDGILLLKHGVGDNIAKLDFDGTTIWSIKADGVEILQPGDAYYSTYSIGIQNTGSHYVIMANQLQRLAVSFDGEVLVKEGDITPSQWDEYNQAQADAYNSNLNSSSNTEPIYATVTPHEGLNLRVSPSTSAESLGIIGQGGVVEILDDVNTPGWAYVKHIANDGSIHEGFVSIAFIEYVD
jgi:hypothetical protein